MKHAACAGTKVSIASTAGFCFGVRRAINLAEETAKGKNKIYTFGPLIHNPQEVERLDRRGIKAVESVSRLKNVTLILRTHGIPARLRQKLKSGGLHLVDATCPFVKRAQDIVWKLAKKKRQVLIVGDKTHPEVVALVSYAGDNFNVVEKKSDIKKLVLSDHVGVVSQTTQTPENFNDIIECVRLKRPGAEIYNTICRATIDRQADAQRLAKKVDVMVVVGGKNSGNTRRLFEICRRYTRAYAVETADEIRSRWFKNVKSCGVTAGASTPDWIIRDIKSKVESIATCGGKTNGRSKAKQ